MTTAAMTWGSVRQLGRLPGSAAGWVLFVAAMTGLLVLATSPALTEVLRYEREAVVAGETWRLVSGHFVHVDPLHGVMNLAAIVLTLGVFRVWTPLIFFSQCLFLAIAVSLALLFLAPELQWYVGLSGLVHGLVVYGAARRGLLGERLYWGVLVLVAIKLLFEQTAAAPPLLAGESGIPVIVDAHLYGALAGIFLASATCLTVSNDY